VAYPVSLCLRALGVPASYEILLFEPVLKLYALRDLYTCSSSGTAVSRLGDRTGVVLIRPLSPPPLTITFVSKACSCCCLSTKLPLGEGVVVTVGMGRRRLMVDERPEPRWIEDDGKTADDSNCREINDETYEGLLSLCTRLCGDNFLLPSTDLQKTKKVSHSKLSSLSLPCPTFLSALI
jgi:hypothetical protein